MGFLSEEANTFLTDIPVLSERDEPEATASDQMLTDPQSDLGNLVHSTTNPDLAWCQLSLSHNLEPIDGLTMSSVKIGKYLQPLLGQLVLGNPIC